MDIYISILDFSPYKMILGIDPVMFYL